MPTRNADPSKFSKQFNGGNWRLVQQVVVMLQNSRDDFSGQIGSG
jgi:hypothetical protein